MNTAPTNAERAQRVSALIATHPVYDKDAGSDPEISALYLLTDLHHLAHAQGFDLAELFEDARENFDTELAEEKGEE